MADLSETTTNGLHIKLMLPSPSPKYPAKQNARNVSTRLPSVCGLIHLVGTPSQNLEDSDMPAPFRQRRYFQYLSGVTDIPDCELLYCLETDELTLYIPPLDPSAVLWYGMPLGVKECLEKYDVDAVTTTPHLLPALTHYRRINPTSPIYILPPSSPSTPHPPSPYNTTHLKPVLNTCRVYKSPFEISLLRRANAITASAHSSILRTLPFARNESHLEASYLSTCIRQFAKSQAYAPIIGSGTNAATLHYSRNDSPLRPEQLVLIDAGCEWEGYCADVTRTVPVSGNFTPEQKEIYDLVQEMQDACIARAVAGVDFRDVFLLAHRIAVRGLVGMGILRGNEEEVWKAGTSRAFFPHGLGHMVGLDVHDVELPSWGVTVEEAGVYDTINFPLHGERVAPRVLEKDMVVTVEPGIYFSRFIIKPYLEHPVHSKYIDAEVLERYWDVGGVRIEDDILILAEGEGNENLTTAPKGEEMLKVIQAAMSVGGQSLEGL
ncbi:Creatinase/aminopeptidase [Wilcoxina mikolae CBS 423.85]|nr:Creatinase/aminopeptidase [Wilcoxina mikolae CBS 423.85]